MIPIKQYWELKDASKSTQPVRKSKRLERVHLCRLKPSNKFSFYIILIFISFFIRHISSQTIRDSFKYCDTNNNLRRMDLHTPCRKPLKQLSPFAQVLQPRDNSSDSKIYGILKRLSHEVSGNGYECSMEKYSIRTYMGFLMGISQLYKIEPIPISVRIKKCTNHDMVCDGQSCFYRASLQPTYQWLTSLTFEDYSCHSTRRVISAN
jgi:hypothetical protein